MRPGTSSCWTTRRTTRSGRPYDIAARYDKFEVPALHITGWYDWFAKGTSTNYAGLRAKARTERARRNQRLVVGFWTHAQPGPSVTKVGDVDFGPQAVFDGAALREQWFNCWMIEKGCDAFSGPPVRLFIMGENRWRDENEWPLARARATAYYLHSKGRANTLKGDGVLTTTPPGDQTPDRYSYDPWEPVPTGPSGGYSRAPADQRPVEERSDVLVYTTEPLAQAVEVTGPISATLWIASSARDTDFTAKLVDVFPDGTARLLTDGILRTRYRQVEDHTGITGARHTDRADHRRRRHGERVPGGSSHPAGDLEQQLSAIRSQPEYGSGLWRERRAAGCGANGVSRREETLPTDSACHPAMRERTSRRAAVATGLFVLASAVAGLWWLRGRPAARPNILLVTIDTLRTDRVGAYGARDVATPALDRLAREGVRFDAAYATVPLTLPSHATILSGWLPAAHSVRTNDGYRVPPEVPLVAQSLREAGYDTGAVVGAFVLRRATGLARGFALYVDDMGPRGERRAGEVAARARQWLEQPRSVPWFLWVHFFDAHLDYDPPEPYRLQYRDRLYDGEVAAVDASLESLVELLEKQGVLDETAVIVAADHGEALGDHGEASHGALLYDAVMRVPLVLRLPSIAPAGRVVTQPVSLTEIAPTIGAVAGLRSAGGSPGLLAQLRADPTGASPAVSETLYLKMLLGWSPLYSLRNGRHKIIDAPSPELYDLEADPLERRNLAETDRARTDDMLDLLRTELSHAAGRAARAVTGTDADARRMLASLGYVATSGGQRAVALAGGPAATTHIALWRQIEEGLALSLHDDHVSAARVFEDVLRQDPGNVLALKFVGARALETGDLPRAVALNERVAASGLHVADASSNLVLAYDRLGRVQEALAAAARALDADPEHVAARYNRAVVLARLERTARGCERSG